MRRRWYERHPQARRHLARPVISIGNLSVGGTGKTPLVAQIAEWLVSRGERPAVLSRGYGRAVREDGVVVVSDGARVLSNVDRAGDEPLMLARTVAGTIVAVAEDRHLAGTIAERHFGATVHLLDDGFQHVQLWRDMDVLMTRVGEVAQGRVLPFGRLREGVDAAARADLVVVLHADFPAARTEAWSLGISQSVGARRVLSLSRRSSLELAGAEPDAPGAVVAIAGIAHPEQFFEMLRAAGDDVVETIAFADHHRYGPGDIVRIGESARSTNATAVVTTEKDLVRLERAGALPFRVVAVPMRLEIDGWDVLTSAIDAALARAREAA